MIIFVKFVKEDLKLIILMMKNIVKLKTAFSIQVNIEGLPITYVI